mmetsp:Transcript_7763/g.18307  ORF Transcript_7763/g.18307 Transcript_7763/m.18307 type:complete len:718 (-) Transcript_7763:232-2385(-)
MEGNLDNKPPMLRHAWKALRQIVCLPMDDEEIKARMEYNGGVTQTQKGTLPKAKSILSVVRACILSGDAEIEATGRLSDGFLGFRHMTVQQPNFQNAWFSVKGSAPWIPRQDTSDEGHLKMVFEAFNLFRLLVPSPRKTSTVSGKLSALEYRHTPKKGAQFTRMDRAWGEKNYKAAGSRADPVPAARTPLPKRKLSVASSSSSPSDAAPDTAPLGHTQKKLKTRPLDNDDEGVMEEDAMEKDVKEEQEGHQAANTTVVDTAFAAPSNSESAKTMARSVSDEKKESRLLQHKPKAASLHSQPTASASGPSEPWHARNSIIAAGPISNQTSVSEQEATSGSSQTTTIAVSKPTAMTTPVTNATTKTAGSSQHATLGSNAAMQTCKTAPTTTTAAAWIIASQAPTPSGSTEQVSSTGVARAEADACILPDARGSSPTAPRPSPQPPSAATSLECLDAVGEDGEGDVDGVGEGCVPVSRVRASAGLVALSVGPASASRVAERGGGGGKQPVPVGRADGRTAMADGEMAMVEEKEKMMAEGVEMMEGLEMDLFWLPLDCACSPSRSFNPPHAHPQPAILPVPAAAPDTDDARTWVDQLPQAALPPAAPSRSASIAAGSGKRASKAAGKHKAKKIGGKPAPPFPEYGVGMPVWVVLEEDEEDAEAAMRWWRGSVTARRVCKGRQQAAHITLDDGRATWIKLPHAGPQSAVPEPVRDGLELSGA